MNTTRTRAAVTASLLAVTSVVASCSAADGTSSSADACGYAFVMQDPMTGSTAEQTIKRGLDRAADELGVEIDVTDGTGIAGVADNLRAAAAKGCYDAIGVPFFANGDAVTQVAPSIPTRPSTSPAASPAAPTSPRSTRRTRRAPTSPERWRRP